MTTAHKHNKRTSLSGRFKTYLLTGILVAAPIYLTFYIVITLIGIIDKAVMPLLPAGFDRQQHFYLIPGFGILIVIAVLVLVGFLTAGWIGKYFVKMGDRLLSKTPVLSGIYKTLKQVFETFLGNNSQSFRQVVFIEFPRKDCWTVAFVMGDAPAEMGKDMQCVFVPNIPIPTSGYMLILNKNQIKKSKMTVDQGLKYVVSMGAVPPENRPARKKSLNRK